jgi:hypothetical protein
MTMTSLTDRYVHAVTTQLPEGQRDDIARELRATIQDTVAAAPPGADPAGAERQVLLDLGHPAALADSYRGERRALIGPRLYPAWLRTLKALLTWVPVLAAILMLVLGALNGEPLLQIIGGAVSALVWSALQVAFWVTLGFAIAERTGAGNVELDALGVDDHDDWDPADLPEPEDRGHVSWGDAISAVLGNALLLALLLLPYRLGGQVEGVEWGQIFTDSFYSLRWLLAAGVALSLLVSIVVLARRRWTWRTALTHLAGGLAFTAPLVWLAARNDLFAWDTLPLDWLRPGETLEINEPLTLGITVAVLVAILAWEIVDSFRRAARSR